MSDLNLLPVEYKAKRGDERSDGKVFWHKGLWIDKDKFEQYNYLSKRRASLNYIKHKEAIKIRKLLNKNGIAKAQHTYYCKNKQYLKQYRKEYFQLNKGRINQYMKKYIKNRSATNSSFRIQRSICSRIRNAMAGKTKGFPSLKLVGVASWDVLKKYLESKFLPNMTWDNYGTHGWHIDHIIPCARFDFTQIEQQKQCFHYSNLQPLWAHDNWIKNKY